MDSSPPFNPAAYKYIKKLGSGSFGTCWLVVDDQGRYYAMKELSFGGANREEAEKARKESELLRGLNHPHIVRGYGCVENQRKTYILMQYCDGGDLGKLIARHAQGRILFREDQILSWAAQLASAIWYMHSRRLMHRDIKTANIFLNRDKTLFLGDLGTGRNITRNSLAHTFIGTPLYMSPELLDRLPYSYPTDMWAVGCVIVEMATLRVTFDARDMVDLHMRVVSGRIPELPSMYSDDLREICRRLLAQDPNSRLTAAELCMQPAVNRYIKKLGIPGPKQSDVDFSKTLVAHSDDAAIYRTYRPGMARDVETELTDFIRDNAGFNIGELSKRGMPPRGEPRPKSGRNQGARPSSGPDAQVEDEPIGLPSARAPQIPDKKLEDQASNLARKILEERLHEEIHDRATEFRLKNAVKISYSVGIPGMVAAAANVELPARLRAETSDKEKWHQNSAEAWNRESEVLEYIFDKLLPDKAVSARALKICRQLAINEALN